MAELAEWLEQQELIEKAVELFSPWNLLILHEFLENEGSDREADFWKAVDDRLKLIGLLRDDQLGQSWWDMEDTDTTLLEIIVGIDCLKGTNPYRCAADELAAREGAPEGTVLQ